jgi:hypothetical protein
LEGHAESVPQLVVALVHRLWQYSAALTECPGRPSVSRRAIVVHYAATVAMK